VIRGNRQENRRVPGIWIIGPAGNLAAIIDVRAADAVVVQIQRGARADQSVEIAHHAVFPEEDSAVPTGIARAAYHLSFIANPTGGTKDISGKGAEILHMVFFGPEEGMGGDPVGQNRVTNDLTPVIDDEWDSAVGAAQIAQVKRPAVLPKQGVDDGLAIRRATSRYTDHLAMVVDSEGNSDGVATQILRMPAWN